MIEFLESVVMKYDEDSAILQYGESFMKSIEREGKKERKQQDMREMRSSMPFYFFLMNLGRLRQIKISNSIPDKYECGFSLDEYVNVLFQLIPCSPNPTLSKLFEKKNHNSLNCINF